MAKPQASADEISRRPAHPLAKRLWSILRDRPEADRRLIHEALRSRLIDQEQVGNQAIAREALVRFGRARAAATQAESDSEEVEAPHWSQGPPSKRRYTTFRKAQTNPKDWPSAAMITYAFGKSWDRARDAAGLEAAPDYLVRRRTSNGYIFTKEIIQELLLEWVAELDAAEKPRQAGSPKSAPLSGESSLSLSAFNRWLKRRRRAVSPESKPLPSQPTIQKHLGPWPEALRGVGLLHRHPEVWRARVARERGGEVWRGAEAAVARLDLAAAPTNARRRHRTGAFTPDDVLGWLTWIGAALSAEQKRVLTLRSWKPLRQAAILRAAENGLWLDIPCANRIIEVEGIASWPEVKVAAGFCEAGEVAHQRMYEAYSEADLLRAFAEAARESGELPGRAAYARWRERERAKRQERDPWARLPSDVQLCHRLCENSLSWDEVVTKAVEAMPELASLPRRRHGNAGRSKKTRRAKARGRRRRAADRGDTASSGEKEEE